MIDRREEAAMIAADSLPALARWYLAARVDPPHP
jgi:hypothetical protein